MKEQDICRAPIGADQVPGSRAGTAGTLTSHIQRWLLEQIAEDESRVRLMGRPLGEELMAGLSLGRVLAEGDAKRRIIELHRPANPDATPVDGYPGWPDHAWYFCRTCGSGEPYEYPTDWPCATLKLMALPFADRPGYREEWAV